MSGNGRSRQVEQARPRLGAVWEKKGRSEGNGRRRDFFGPSGLRGPLAALTWALGRPTLFNLVSRVSCLHRRRGRRKEMEERECAMQSRCGRKSGGVSPSGQIRPTRPHLSTVDRLIPCQPGASADRESTADSSHLLVAPARLKFEVKLAEGLVLNKKWDDLEEYLFRFLTNVEGDRKHSHPGLFYPLYEAYVSDLICER